MNDNRQNRGCTQVVISRRPSGPRKVMPTTILVVDDDRFILDALAGYVLAPMQSVCVDTCTAARARMSAGNLQGFIADVRLADGTGLDLLDEWISKSPSGPAAVMTGFPEESTFANHASRKNCRFLAKPFVREDLGAFFDDVSAARWKVPQDVARRFELFVASRGLTLPQAALAAKGARRESHARIAEELGVSITTLKTRLGQLCEKVGEGSLGAVYAAMLRVSATG